MSLVTNLGGNDRIAVIGSGHVGATTAYALAMEGIAREIVLVDSDPGLATAEAMDLQHAVPLEHPVRIWAGSYRDAADAAIAIIAAGSHCRSGQTRLDLLDRNLEIVRECVDRLRAQRFDGILVMATNPVDILAQIAQQVSGLPVEQVWGTGTLLDTIRLRTAIGANLAVEPRDIHAYMLGEHGESQVLAWSAAQVAGVPLRDHCAARGDIDPEDLARRVRQAAPEIVKHKGYTSFAIATCIARICQAVLRNEHAVLPLSTMTTGQYGSANVYLSLPCVVGRSGIEQVIELPLSSKEQEALRTSATILRQMRDETGNRSAMA